MSLIAHLEDILGQKTKDVHYYQTAFNHSSYVNEHPGKGLKNNERLEFLGDSVLELAVSEYLFNLYQDKAEGDLTRLRAQLVREESLAYLARELSFDRYILMGRGEMEHGGNQRNSVLADVFEAFLGATYLDLGYQMVADYIDQLMDQEMDYLINALNKDHKTAFQELAQQQGAVEIDYRIEQQAGPAHDQTFTVGLYLNQQRIATGEGKSRKAAETAAAQRACQCMDEKGNVIQCF